MRSGQKKACHYSSPTQCGSPYVRNGAEKVLPKTFLRVDANVLSVAYSIMNEEVEKES